jgi:hypothetical protein
VVVGCSPSVREEFVERTNENLGDKNTWPIGWKEWWFSLFFEPKKKKRECRVPVMSE